MRLNESRRNTNTNNNRRIITHNINNNRFYENRRIAKNHRRINESLSKIDKENLMEFLKGLDEEEINNIAIDIDMDDIWEPMDNLDDATGGMSHWEVLRCAHFGDFNPMHHYFRFDVYGNLESIEFLNYDESDLNEIVDTIETTPYKYLPDEIKNIIG